MERVIPDIWEGYCYDADMPDEKMEELLTNFLNYESLDEGYRIVFDIDDLDDDDERPNPLSFARCQIKYPMYAILLREHKIVGLCGFGIRGREVEWLGLEGPYIDKIMIWRPEFTEKQVNEIFVGMKTGEIEEPYVIKVDGEEREYYSGEYGNGGEFDELYDDNEHIKWFVKKYKEVGTLEREGKIIALIGCHYWSK